MCVCCFCTKIDLFPGLHLSPHPVKHCQRTVKTLWNWDIASFFLFFMLIAWQFWFHLLRTGIKDPEVGNDTVGKLKAGTAGFLVEIENRRSIKVCSSTSFMALYLWWHVVILLLHASTIMGWALFKLNTCYWYHGNWTGSSLLFF